MKLKPQDGGCWYCHEDEENERLLFCMEFDTYIHINCIKKRKEDIIKNKEYDPEWEIIAREFGL